MYSTINIAIPRPPSRCPSRVAPETLQLNSQIQFNSIAFGILHPIQDSLNSLGRSTIRSGSYALGLHSHGLQHSLSSLVSAPQLTELAKYFQQFPTKVFWIAPSSVNLAGSISFLAWGGNRQQDQKTERQLRSLGTDLALLENSFSTTGGGYAIVNPGFYKHAGAGATNLESAIQQSLRHLGSSQIILCPLALENKFLVGRDSETLLRICRQGFAKVGANVWDLVYGIGEFPPTPEGAKNLLAKLKPECIILMRWCGNSQSYQCLRAKLPGAESECFPRDFLLVLLHYSERWRVPILTHCHEDLNFLSHLLSEPES